jgi:hypothetical protein
MKDRGISVHPAFTAHQQANFVERSVQHVKQILRTTLDGLPTQLWPKVLRGVVQHINMTDHSSKGASPFEILTGWAPRGFVHHDTLQAEAVLGDVLHKRGELWQLVHVAMEAAAIKQADAYNKRHSDRRFAVGDVVLVKMPRQEQEDGNFNLSPPYDPNPRIVEHVLSEVTLLLRDCERDGKLSTIHVGDVVHAVTEIDARNADDEEQFVVQKIHKHRIVSGKVHYLVQWGGYRDKRTYTWEPVDSLAGSAQDILARYNKLAKVNETVTMRAPQA